MLLFVLLTGAAPPFEKMLGQGCWAGLCVDTWQRRVSEWLCTALHARQPPTPVARSAQVRPVSQPGTACTAPWRPDSGHCHAGSATTLGPLLDQTVLQE